MAVLWCRMRTMQKKLEVHRMERLISIRRQKNELMTLSGIGEAKADAIVRYREEHGAFQKIEDLMEVEGIKEGVFQKVKDQIKI